MMYKLFLLILLSCSSLSEKYVLNGKVRIKGGRVGADSWSESLILKRATWYQGAKLEYDNYIAKIRGNSNFIKWFSPREFEKVKSCQTILVSLTNTNFHDVLLNSDIVNQMQQNGFKQIPASNFIKNFEMHPEYKQWNLTMYTPRIFCSPSAVQELSLVFPSYDQVKITI